MRMRSIAGAIVLLALVASVVGCKPKGDGTTSGPSTGSGDSEEPTGYVTIGSKNFTEQVLIAEIVGQMLEHRTGLEVDRALNLGGTFVCFEAMKQGDIDLYVEYTGTALVAIMEQDVIRDPDEVYDLVSTTFSDEYDLTWLRPFGFNNTYALTMRQADADALNIATISDLVPHAGDMVLGCTYEFLERPDGYPKLKEAYGLEFESTKGMDAGLTYMAVESKAVDAIDGFATDGRIPAFGLVILEDDKGFFPPYHAAPLVRSDTLAAHPEIAEVLARLEGTIDDATMRDMNYRVDEENESLEDVARQFLLGAGLLVPEEGSSSPTGG